MAPLAPPRFSTNTCWPRRSERCFAASRPMKSVPPPAGNGTIILIGRCGQACASAVAGRAQASTSKAASLPNRMRMLLPPDAAPLGDGVPAGYPGMACGSPSSLHGGGDRVSHFGCAGAPAQIAGEVLAVGNHTLDRGLDAVGGGLRLGLAPLAAEPGEQHLPRDHHGVGIGYVASRDVGRRAV